MSPVLDEIEQRGIAIGEQRGEQRGQHNTAKLMGILVSSGRSEDIVKASEDDEFLDNLFKEFADRLKPEENTDGVD